MGRRLGRRCQLAHARLVISLLPLGIRIGLLKALQERKFTTASIARQWRHGGEDVSRLRWFTTA